MRVLRYTGYVDIATWTGYRSLDMCCYRIANFVFVLSAMIFSGTWYLYAATSTTIYCEVGTLRTQRDLGLVVGLRALILECANMPP